MNFHQMRKIFCFFGFEPFSEKFNSFYWILFFQSVIVLSLDYYMYVKTVIELEGRESIGTEVVQYYSLLLIHVTIIVESIIGRNCFVRVNRLLPMKCVITRGFVRKMTRKFLIRLIIFTIIYITTEFSFYFSNPSNEGLKKMIIANLYLYFFKHMREFHFIYYINVSHSCLEGVEGVFDELLKLPLNIKNYKKSTRKFRETFVTYSNLRIFIKKSVNIFQWSITMIITQNLLQLIVEFYWIAFGYMNTSSNSDYDKHVLQLTFWPLLICLIPKISLPLYMWESCEKIYQIENRIFHKLQQWDVKKVENEGFLQIIAYNPIQMRIFGMFELRNRMLMHVRFLSDFYLKS